MIQSDFFIQRIGRTISFKSKATSAETQLDVNRLIALWGFTEATLGGISHLLRIPLTGLFIGSAAVIYISLIAQNSRNKSEILKATLIVILVKAFVSPYTPITAYFAVTVQGILGYLFFSISGFKKITAPIFGMAAITLSGFQKIIILTLLFGNTLWKSIDEFTFFVLKQFNFSDELPAGLSLIIIGIYLSLHMAAGLIAGVLSLRIPHWFNSRQISNGLILSNYENSLDIFNQKKFNKKERWWNKKSGLAIIVFGIVFVALSFIYPQLGKNKAFDVLIMFARSIIITLVWFYLLSPLIIKWFKKFVSRKQYNYATEMNAVIELFPSFKNITAYVFNLVKNEKGLSRIKKFISTWFVLMLTKEPDLK
ncbi:MAG: hypothetical protein V1720_20070 [bacterium]